MSLPGLDPAIIEHHIVTWPDVPPVRQKQRPIHPSKLPAVKAEIEKFARQDSFILLPIPLGFQTLFLLTKNKASLEYALTSKI